MRRFKYDATLIRDLPSPVTVALAAWPILNPIPRQMVILADTYDGVAFRWPFEYRPDLDGTYPWAALADNGYGRLTGIGATNGNVIRSLGLGWKAPRSGSWSAIGEYGCGNDHTAQLQFNSYIYKHTAVPAAGVAPSGTQIGFVSWTISATSGGMVSSNEQTAAGMVGGTDYLYVACTSNHSADDLTPEMKGPRLLVRPVKIS